MSLTDKYKRSPVVGPGTELYGARLVIEWEISYVDVTRCREDTTWFPVNLTRVAQHNTHFAEVGCQLIRTVNTQ